MLQLQERRNNLININQIYEISLEEPTVGNVKWELQMPLNGVVVNTKYSAGNTTNALKRSWYIQVPAKGTYTLTFNLRKMCCGRKIIETKTYTLVAK